MVAEAGCDGLDRSARPLIGIGAESDLFFCAWSPNSKALTLIPELRLQSLHGSGLDLGRRVVGPGDETPDAG